MTGGPPQDDQPDLALAPPAAGPAVERAFGAGNRARLLTRYFAQAGEVSAANAWEHAYRLLLWIDRTTSLAHCYESDKCQPGRPWYARSLAFHDWVSSALGATPAELADNVDLLFRWAAADLAASAAARRNAVTPAAERQREPYADRGFPEPGEDPELESIITEALEPYLRSPPPPDALRRLTERIQAHVGQENKRKNLVGEGFEDTIAAVLERTPGVGGAYDLHVRPWLHDLPGFYRPRGGEKPRQVDLALVRRADGRRTLVSCKWSVRSDREEQFATDFAAYARLEAAGRDFGYVLVTNEFDPARLAAACGNRRENALLFSAVVHVNPDGPRAAYRAPVPHRGTGISRALAYADSGRLSSLATWLSDLATPLAQ